MPAESAERLLERERELAAIGDALDEARGGRGRVVLVEAPAGLGKTSLLDAAAAVAAGAGFRVLRARASELERDFAYGAVRQLLEPVVARASEPERARLFGAAASLSEPLFAPPGEPLPLASVSADTSFPMLHGLYWLLNNLADEGPVALTVDDLHWSDPESLRFLNYLAPRLDGLPLAVLASMRSGEAVTADLARLAAAPEAMLLRPGPLSVEATATLCERRLGPAVAPEFAAACRTATGGNPFFLEALLREAHQQRLATDAPAAARVRDIAPTAVARAVLLRLSSRPAAATALVRAVAVLGDGASLGVAARLAGLAEDEAADAADLLIALALLAPAPALEFAHPIVREAVYSDIGAHERAAAHARAAAILAAAGAPEERIAAQIVHAPPAGDGERVELLRRVAADARRRGAPAAAVAWLSRALAEPPPPTARAEVLLELGLVEYRLGAPETVDHLAEAVALSREPVPRATAVRWLALALTMSGDSDRAVDAIASAVEVVEPHDGELALLLEGDLAAHAQEAGVERRAPAARRLERFAGLEGATPGERLVLASLAFERARASDSEREAAAHLEGALAGGWLPGEQDVDVAGPFYLLLVGLLATDALDLAEKCVERALADPRVRSSTPALAYLLEFRGWVSLRQGAVAHAEADARTALELLTARGITFGLAFALGLLVEALIEEGEVEAAESALLRQRPRRRHPARNGHQRPARGARPAEARPGQGARGARRPARVRPPRRALGRREPARLALALARGARLCGRRGRRRRPPDGRRRPRAGEALGGGERDRRRAARRRAGRRRPVLGRPPARGRRRPRGLAGAARARPRARRSRRGAAPRQPPRRRAPRAPGRARPRLALRRLGPRRARPDGAARRRGPLERPGGRRARRS